MRTTLATILLISTHVLSQGQGWKYDRDFRTDIWTAPIDHNVEIVNCNTGSRNNKMLGICMRQDVQSGFDNPTLISNVNKTLSGLQGKVARGVEAQRPKRKISTSRTKASSMAEAKRTGKNYNHATSASGRAWQAQRAAQRQEAIERARERKREEERQRKIADDNRAAAVTAQTNAMLQAETNRRINSDYYHATQGAYEAQQRARQAHKMVGPQFKRQQTSKAQQAEMLRGQNKPRRVMAPQTTARNTYRKPLPTVQRKPQQKTLAVAKGIRLSDNAVSTLGKDWRSDDFKTPPLAPPPVTRSRPVYTEPKWLTEHKMKVTEFLGLPPLTHEEEIELLKKHEFFSAL